MSIALPRLIPETTPEQSELGRRRLLACSGEPLFLADWMRVLMMHFEVDTAALQREVPYPLDLYDNRAFVTLVAFTMENMRPRLGGKLGAWLFRPIATHDFLNVRTYVRHRDEAGIHFLAEWLSNWLAVQLGPRTFGLPYRHGRIAYDHDWDSGSLSGCVTDPAAKTNFKYCCTTERGANFLPCARGSLPEWLMERYAAFNSIENNKRLFRIWHPAWPQCPVTVTTPDLSLLTKTWPWFASSRLIGANYSLGLSGVWMGRPHSVKESNVG